MCNGGTTPKYRVNTATSYYYRILLGTKYRVDIETNLIVTEVIIILIVTEVIIILIVTEVIINSLITSYLLIIVALCVSVSSLSRDVTLNLQQLLIQLVV